MTPKVEMRVLAGLAVQPVAAFAAAFVAFPALIYTGSAVGNYPGAFPDPTGAAASVAFAAALASVFVCIAGALPAIAWLARRGPLTLAKSLVSGAVLGNMPAAVILILAALTGNLVVPETGPAIDVVRMLPTIGFGAIVGMACAFVFWMIAREPETSICNGLTK